MGIISKIQGVIQTYDWGGERFISKLLNQEKTDSVPWAEYWMGTHAKGVARLEDGRLLTNFLETSETYGLELPYLFKVLDVNNMLSIQSHPNAEQARMGFELEEQTGLSVLDPQRTYRDPNPKPEVMVALSDFWLLHGFRSLEAILTDFENHFGLTLPPANSGSIKAVFEFIFAMPQDEINRLIQNSTADWLPLLEDNQPDKANHTFWMAKACRDFCQWTPDYDRGILVILMLNIVHLQAGEGIFQDAGILHAYLEGKNKHANNQQTY